MFFLDYAKCFYFSLKYQRNGDPPARIATNGEKIGACTVECLYS